MLPKHYKSFVLSATPLNHTNQCSLVMCCSHHLILTRPQGQEFTLNWVFDTCKLELSRAHAVQCYCNANTVLCFIEL